MFAKDPDTNIFSNTWGWRYITNTSNHKTNLFKVKWTWSASIDVELSQDDIVWNSKIEGSNLTWQS